MSYWPLPKNLVAELVAAARLGPVVEAGVGDGRFLGRLASVGVDAIGLDRILPCDLVADFLHLPFRPSSVGGLIFADTMRHLDSADRSAALVAAGEALGPGGALLVIEDLPDAANAAEANYRQVLELLAEADPSRGAALDLGELDEQLDENFGAEVLDVVCANEEVPADPMLPLRWLAFHGARHEDLVLLEREIQRHGMSYGPYRARLFQRSGVADGGAG